MYRYQIIFEIVLALVVCSTTAQTAMSVTGYQSVGGRITTGPNSGVPVSATGSNGSDAGVLINSCLQSAISSGTNICDARSLTGTTYQLTTNMAAHIGRPVQLLLSPGTIFSTKATQVLPAGFVITVAKGGNSTGIAYPGAPTVDFDWTGANGGMVFDLKDSPNSRLGGLLIDCNHIAAVGVNLSGGILNTFNPYLEDAVIQNCTWGVGVAIDNYGPTSFGVTVSRLAQTLSGTLTAGSFPQSWIGKSSLSGFQIDGASDGSFNTPTGTGIVVTITSATTFTASTPQGAWAPANASGVTGTLKSYSEAQEWTCYGCDLAGGNIGYRTASAGARILASDIAANSVYGVELYGYGQFSASDSVFTQNGTDIYIASSGQNTLAQTSNVWFENSSVGVLGAGSGVAGYTVDFTNAILHSSSASGLVDVSSAGAGTINFIAATINPLTKNPSIKGNAAATMNYSPWSVGGITTPRITGFGALSDAVANLSGTSALPNGVTATTQAAGDTSARLATDAFVAGTMAAPGAIGERAAAASMSTKVSRIDSTQTAIPCSTSGTAYFSQPEQGPSYKVVVINLQACTGTATYSYPAAYVLAPGAIGPLASLAAAGPLGVTITAGRSGSTGVLILVGF